MSNLIPTPRADKNGKIVTRHVSPNQANGSKNIPAPFSTTAKTSSASPDAPKEGSFISRWKDRRRQQKATDALVATLFPNETDEYAGTTAEYWRAGLDGLLSTDELEMSVGLAKLVTREGVPSELASKDQKQILWALRRERFPERTGITVRALHAHKDWLEDHPGEAIKLCRTIRELLEHDLISNGGRDGIQHLNEYVAATNHPAYQDFGIIAIWRKGYLETAVRYPDQLDNVITYTKGRRGFREDEFDDYLLAVTKYPDKTDRMFDYMKERDEFDVGGFDEYLNAATPLADGAL